MKDEGNEDAGNGKDEENNGGEGKPDEQNYGPRVERVQEELYCRLTEEEKAKAADTLVELREGADRIAERKAAAASGFKAEAEKIETQVSEVVSQIRHGVLKPVDCEVHYDFAAGTVTTVRLDTGEEVRSRKMTLVDRQQALALGSAQGTAGDDAPEGDAAAAEGDAEQSDADIPLSDDPPHVDIKPLPEDGAASQAPEA